MKSPGSIQSIPECRQENERPQGSSLWYHVEFESHGTEKVKCQTFSVPLVAGMPETASDDLFGDIGFWGTTYNLNCLRIFKCANEAVIYIETTKPTDISFLLEIIGRVLKSDSVPGKITRF